MENLTIDNIKNRPDKSYLHIYGTRPDLFLNPNVASSDQVKHLDLYMSNNTWWDPNMSQQELENVFGVWDYSDKELEEYAEGYPKSWQFYTTTLCKDIVHFKNLETFKTYDLKLTTDLWLEFIQNNQTLKKVEIYYETVTAHIDIKVIKQLLLIPTLEDVCLWNIPTLYLPPGPSNITKLMIDRFYEDDIEHAEEKQIMLDSWTTNLRTHTNLQKVHIHGNMLLNTMKPFVDLGLTCTQLEEIDLFSNGYNEIDLKPLTEILLTIPSLKKLRVNRKDIVVNKHPYNCGCRRYMEKVQQKLSSEKLYTAGEINDLLEQLMAE